MSWWLCKRVRDFCLHHLHSTPPLGGGSRQNIAIPFSAVKLEWCGHPTVEKNEDIFIRFDTMHERDGHKDTHTYTAWRHRPLLCIASRSRNHPLSMKFCTQLQVLNCWMNVTWSKMKKVALNRLRVRQNVFLVVFCIVFLYTATESLSSLTTHPDGPWYDMTSPGEKAATTVADVTTSVAIAKTTVAHDCGKLSHISPHVTVLCVTLRTCKQKQNR